MAELVRAHAHPDMDLDGLGDLPHEPRSLLGPAPPAGEDIGVDGVGELRADLVDVLLDMRR
jgi:hypothetical protein